jgi:hypothetical protein
MGCKECPDLDAVPDALSGGIAHKGGTTTGEELEQIQCQLPGFFGVGLEICWRARGHR